MMSSFAQLRYIIIWRFDLNASRSLSNFIKDKETHKIAFTGQSEGIGREITPSSARPATGRLELR
tara:strand:- start:658 stop:852 length:195 start_codon:yes stop_codon:yes gene_type:complete